MSTLLGSYRMTHQDCDSGATVDAGECRTYAEDDGTVRWVWTRPDSGSVASFSSDEDAALEACADEIVRLARRTGPRGVTERDLNIASRVFRASPERMRSDALLSLQRRDEIALVEIVSASGRGRRRHAYVSTDSLNNDDKR